MSVTFIWILTTNKMFLLDFQCIICRASSCGKRASVQMQKRPWIKSWHICQHQPVTSRLFLLLACQDTVLSATGQDWGYCKMSHANKSWGKTVICKTWHLLKLGLWAFCSSSSCGFQGSVIFVTSCLFLLSTYYPYSCWESKLFWHSWLTASSTWT